MSTEKLERQETPLRHKKGWKLLCIFLLMPYVLRFCNAWIRPYLMNKYDDQRYLFENPLEQVTPPGPFTPITNESRYVAVSLGTVRPVSFSKKGELIFQPKGTKSFFVRDTVGKVAELDQLRFPQYMSSGEIADVELGPDKSQMKISSGEKMILTWKLRDEGGHTIAYDAPSPRTTNYFVLDLNLNGSVLPCFSDGKRLSRVQSGKVITTDLRFSGESSALSILRTLRMIDDRDLRIAPSSLRLKEDGSPFALAFGTLGPYQSWPNDTILVSIKGDLVTPIPTPDNLKIAFDQMPIVFGNSVVVHCYVNFYQRTRPFLYQDGKWRALPLPTGALAGRLVGMNTKGDFAVSATIGYKSVGFLRIPIYKSYVYSAGRFEQIAKDWGFGSVSGQVGDLYDNSLQSNIGNMMSEDGTILQTDTKLTIDPKGNVTDSTPKTILYIPR